MEGVPTILTIRSPVDRIRQAHRNRGQVNDSRQGLEAFSASAHILTVRNIRHTAYNVNCNSHCVHQVYHSTLNIIT